MSQVFFIIALFVTVATAQYPIKNGTCPDFSTCRDPVTYNNEKIAGIWYVTASIPYFWNVGKKCTYKNYTALAAPNSVHSKTVEYDNV